MLYSSVPILKQLITMFIEPFKKHAQRATRHCSSYQISLNLDCYFLISVTRMKMRCV